MEEKGSEELTCDENHPRNTLLKELRSLGTKTDTLDHELVILAILAGVVALFGLFLNNVSVIIGAMVISPLVEPLYAGVVNLADGKFPLFLKHMFVLFGLLVAIVFVACLITYIASLLSTLQITPEILSRTVRADIYTILAILLGLTAVLAHKRGFIASITGVGIAVALVPPAVVIGISLVVYPSGIVNAIQLTANNVFGMLAGMMMGALLLGTGRRCRNERRLSRRMVYILLIAMLVFLGIVFLLDYVPSSLGFDHEDIIAALGSMNSH